MTPFDPALLLNATAKLTLALAALITACRKRNVFPAFATHSYVTN